MMRRKLLIVTCLVVASYGFAVFIGFLLSKYKPDLYTVYKDLSTLIIATPAAYLAYCFQRRTEYMKTLRDLWLHMINAVQMSIQYTYNPNPPQELHEHVLLELSKVIDEVRGAFKNPNKEGQPKGIYPFEPLKRIREEILDLGFQDISANRRKEAREVITNQWREELIEEFLKEFDRDFPTHPKSPYLGHSRWHPFHT